MVVVHVGTRVERAQRAVEAQRALRAGLLMRWPITICMVAGADQALGALDRNQEIVLGVGPDLGSMRLGPCTGGACTRHAEGGF